MENNTATINVFSRSALSKSVVCEETGLFKSSPTSLSHDSHEWRLKIGSRPEIMAKIQEKVLDYRLWRERFGRISWHFIFTKKKNFSGV